MTTPKRTPEEIVAALYSQGVPPSRLEVLAALREAADARDHSKCQFSTGIDGGITAGSGNLDDNGYWSESCDICAKWANKCEQAAHAARQEEREALRSIDARVSAEPLPDELQAKLDVVVPTDAAQIGYAIACSRWSSAIDARSRAEEPKP